MPCSLALCDLGTCHILCLVLGRQRQRIPGVFLPAVDLAQEGNYITLRNAKIDMYRGSMRLAVDQWGKVEALEGSSFQPKVRHGADRKQWWYLVDHGGCNPHLSCVCHATNGQHLL